MIRWTKNVIHFITYISVPINTDALCVLQQHNTLCEWTQSLYDATPPEASYWYQTVNSYEGLNETWSLCELHSLVQKDGPRCGQEMRIKWKDSGFVFILLLLLHFQLMRFWHRSASSTHKIGLYYVLKCFTGRFLHFWNGSVYLFLGDSVIWVNDDDDDRNKLGYRHPWRTVSNGHHNFSSACSFNLSIALVYDQSPAIMDLRHKKNISPGATPVSL